MPVAITAIDKIHRVCLIPQQYWRKSGRNATLCDSPPGGGFALEGRLHVEEHMFDVARFVEAHQALGERFDFVF